MVGYVWEDTVTKRNDILKELNYEIENYAEHTRRQYLGHITDYLDYCDAKEVDWKERDVLYGYMQKLKKGKSQSHVNYVMRGPIGSLFRAHGLRLPVKLPKTKVNLLDLSHRIAFTAEQVKQLILVAKLSGNPAWQFLMAISTTYGLRATEIRMLRKDDTHRNKKTIFVHTLKGGLDREHLVPPQIAQYIFSYDFPILSTNQMYEIFSEIAKAAGIERIPRKCYHAIRHSLASELVYTQKVDQTTAFKFLRWQGGTMLNIYATPYMPDIDQTIFKAHPFLKYWS